MSFVTSKACVVQTRIAGPKINDCRFLLISPGTVCSSFSFGNGHDTSFTLRDRASRGVPCDSTLSQFHQKLTATLHQVSNMFETSVISRWEIAWKIAPGLHVQFWSWNLSATKIASSCHDKNCLCKRAFRHHAKLSDVINLKELKWAYLRWHTNHYIMRPDQNIYNLNFKDHVLTIFDQMLHGCPLPGKQIPLNRWPPDLLILFQTVLDN